VRHGEFDHREAELPRSRHHLRVHEEPATLRQQLCEHLATEHLQRTIHVANAGAQQRASHPVVAPREEAPLCGVFAIEPVTRDDGVVIRERDERAQFCQVELAIGIGERNERESRRLEARAQRRAVTLVEAVANESCVWSAVADSLVHPSGVVEAAVVDHEDLELGESPGE